MDVARRRRAIDAMGLGPVWTRRGDVAPGAVPDEDGSRRAARIAALDWADLATEVAACTACTLCRTRTQTVFGVGPVAAGVVVVGEAPGADEDEAGEPFVGKAGRLLDAMLAAIGFARDDNAFIANVLKCRPPRNRDPSPAEVAACRPFLERQLALLAPRMILVVGRIAGTALLVPDALEPVSMASLRQKEHRVAIAGREIPAVATYHPAYLLRSPEEKAKAWADLCLARAVFERLSEPA